MAYLPRGLVMIESLRRSGEFSEIIVLALDEASLNVLRDLSLDSLLVVSIENMEAKFPTLAAARRSRSRMEFIFTLTPWLCYFARLEYPEAEWITYLDADLGFFGSCEPIYEELSHASVGIIAHRFPAEISWRAKFGTYNVGWVSFRNDVEGERCLQWWADKCFDWCFDRPEGGKFADQGYLNEFAAIAPNTKVISNPGANLAPWNLGSHLIEDGEGVVLVDKNPLIFFHFHGLRISGNRYFMKHFPYKVRTTSVIRNSIYRPYCVELSEATLHRPVVQPLARRVTIGSLIGGQRTRLLNALAWLRRDFLDL